jgi:hypothetical protein
MNKNRTAEYIAEGLRRAKLRKDMRKKNRKEKLRLFGRRSESTCPDCGGVMVWCCQQWSKICCTDYGTCPCS